MELQERATTKNTSRKSNYAELYSSNRGTYWVGSSPVEHATRSAPDPKNEERDRYEDPLAPFPRAV